MFPASSDSRRRGLTRSRLAAPALLLIAGVGGAALWWSGARTPASFVYLHGDLPSPPAAEDEVMFRLSSADGRQSFTLAQLRAMPAVRYAANQPQLNRNFMYTGVPLRDLAALAGLSGQDLRIAGDNQFAATIRASDYQRFPVMLAYAENGQPISVADKGPLEVVFPSTQYPRLFGPSRYGSQWVWYASTLAAAP